MTIEIYERSTGQVVETIEMDSMEDFRFYWRHQGNSAEYGYRVRDALTTPEAKDSSGVPS